ncbi:hypothetical protein M8C21_030494 [Ambrosia artemisiifolia]|uniref:Uncharacterized protein n=1 Tax=Ambrosia artemisiifolia TaxID=4212 RepID=A0AAD5C4Z0_AMBAR|nr:hypothetical protein M8C21_030494 [Ambrosia artemisiifolia]
MYSIWVRKGGCQPYRSFVGMDYSLAMSSPEPLCGAQTDYDDRSRCARSGTGGVSRCVCNVGFHWNGVDGVCALDLLELMQHSTVEEINPVPSPALTCMHKSVSTSEAGACRFKKKTRTIFPGVKGTIAAIGVTALVFGTVRTIIQH